MSFLNFYIIADDFKIYTLFLFQLPNTSNSWKEIAARYYSKWNFPQCLGAIDGKHIVLQAPMNTGTEYFNYKGTFSIVLLAVVDADYSFIYVDIGCQGRISDGGVFKNSNFFSKLSEGDLNIPDDNALPGRRTPVPFVFVADDAFPLQDHVMKPYPGTQEAGSTERIFNYRLSRARRIVENAFGILSAVFRVLRKPLLLEPEKSKLIVLTCVYLHNFLRKSEADMYASNMFDTETDDRNGIIQGAWRRENQDLTSFLPLRRVPRKSSNHSQEIRKEYANYFCNEGAVPWQNKM